MPPIWCSIAHLLECFFISRDAWNEKRAGNIRGMRWRRKITKKPMMPHSVTYPCNSYIHTSCVGIAAFSLTAETACVAAVADVVVATIFESSADVATICEAAVAATTSFSFGWLHYMLQCGRVGNNAI